MGQRLILLRLDDFRQQLAAKTAEGVVPGREDAPWLLGVTRDRSRRRSDRLGGTEKCLKKRLKSQATPPTPVEGEGGVCGPRHLARKRSRVLTTTLPSLVELGGVDKLLMLPSNNRCRLEADPTFGPAEIARFAQVIPASRKVGGKRATASPSDPQHQSRTSGHKGLLSKLEYRPKVHLKFSTHFGPFVVPNPHLH